jgi:ABC-type multidrug transport system fused ATPase/permease subunit
MLRYLKASLLLLDADARRKFWKFCIVRALISSADIFAIGLLALVGQLVLQASTDTVRSGLTASVLQYLRISNASIQIQISVMIGIAVFVFVIKAVISLVAMSSTFRYLANEEVQVGGRLATFVMTSSLPSTRQVSSQVYSHSLTQGLAAAVQRVLGFSVIFISEGFMLITMTILFVGLEPLTAVTLICYFAIVGLILHKLVSGPSEQLGKLVADSTASNTQVIQESLKGFREFFVTGQELFSVERYLKVKRISSSKTAEILTLAAAPRHIVDTALLVGVALACSINFLVSDTAHALQSIGFVLIAGTRIAPSLLSAQGALAAITQAGGESEFIYQINNEMLETKLVHNTNLLSLHIDSNPHLNISVNLLTYFYPASNSPALDSVTFNIKQGEFVGIVGSSGSGKSTLADLMLGVLPSGGEITIGEVEPIDVVRKFPGALGYVPQETFLMRCSIAENIAMGISAELINESKISQCLKDVGLLNLVDSLPEGINTQVGEDGDLFSGGQKQRIGIARALYFNPRILLFDEATSALDVESELVISSLIRNLRGKVTIIMIAHRLNSVLDADNLLLLENGKLVCQGTFSEVARINKNFADQAAHFGVSFNI